MIILNLCYCLKWKICPRNKIQILLFRYTFLNCKLFVIVGSSFWESPDHSEPWFWRYYRFYSMWHYIAYQNICMTSKIRRNALWAFNSTCTILPYRKLFVGGRATPARLLLSVVYMFICPGWPREHVHCHGNKNRQSEGPEWSSPNGSHWLVWLLIKNTTVNNFLHVHVHVGRCECVTHLSLISGSFDAVIYPKLQGRIQDFANGGVGPVVNFEEK